MALTADRTTGAGTFTAANLNALWTAMLAVLARQVAKPYRATILGWTLNEGDVFASSVGSPRDLYAVAAARLHALGAGVCVWQPFENAPNGFRMWVFEPGGGARAWDLRKGLRDRGYDGFPLLGWVDLNIAGNSYTAGSGTINLCDSRISTEIDMSFITDVESMLDALDQRAPVRMYTATLDAFVASGAGVGKTLTRNGNGALGQIDGVSPSVGDRILYASGDSHAGVYAVTSLGSGGTPWVMTRATDMDTSGSLRPGVYFAVVSGGMYGGGVYEVTTALPITIDSTALVFTERLRDSPTPRKHVSVNAAGTFNVLGSFHGRVFIFDVTAGNQTMVLPAVAGRSGQSCWVRVVGATNTLTIDPNASENVDGQTTKAMSPGNKALLYCDGSQWLSLV